MHVTSCPRLTKYYEILIETPYGILHNLPTLFSFVQDLESNLQEDSQRVSGYLSVSHSLSRLPKTTRHCNKVSFFYRIPAKDSLLNLILVV